MAVHAHSTAFLPRTIVPRLRARDRSAIERQIEGLIDMLDQIDGDADIEDDDPCGDHLDAGEDDGLNRLVRPRYGTDQPQGPMNVEEAYDAYLRAC